MVARVRAVVVAVVGGGGGSGDGGGDGYVLWQLYETCMVKPLPDGAPVYAVVPDVLLPPYRIITPTRRSSHRRASRQRRTSREDSGEAAARRCAATAGTPRGDRAVGAQRGKGAASREDFGEADARRSAGPAIVATTP